MRGARRGARVVGVARRLGQDRRGARRGPRRAGRRREAQAGRRAPEGLRAPRAAEKNARRDRARGRDARPLRRRDRAPGLRDGRTAGGRRRKSLAPGALHVGIARGRSSGSRRRPRERSTSRRTATPCSGSTPQGARDETASSKSGSTPSRRKAPPGPWLSGTYAPAEADSPVLNTKLDDATGVRAVARRAAADGGRASALREGPRLPAGRGRDERARRLPTGSGP